MLINLRLADPTLGLPSVNERIHSNDYRLRPLLLLFSRPSPDEQERKLLPVKLLRPTGHISGLLLVITTTYRPPVRPPVNSPELWKKVDGYSLLDEKIIL